MGASLRNKETCLLLLKVLSQIPDYHKNTFHYVCEFLKEMLKFSEYNGLEIKFLGKDDEGLGFFRETSQQF